MTLDERISRYLEKCPPAVAGSRGHDQTFTVACALVNGFALDEAAALRHLLTYNATCSPPWKERDLRHKVQQAGKIAHTKPRGYLLGGREDHLKEAGQGGARPSPVRLTPKTNRFRTERTLLFQTIRITKKKEHHVYPSRDVDKYGEVASETSELLNGAAQPAEKACSEPSDPSEQGVPLKTVPLADDAGTVRVPGCSMPRPEEIACSDETWQALNAHPLGGEPLVHLALSLFGPNATIISTAEGEPCV